jgi:MFS transporter, PHS family, inorganic phosphate transporter
MVQRINFMDRRFHLIWTSLVLAALLMITGIVFPYCFHTDKHPVLIALYAAIQFWFAFGPNTLLFVLPAEIFPTR